MTFTYTQADLLSRINAGIQGKQGMIISTTDLLNEVVRETNNEIKTRSSIRQTALVPNLYSQEFAYTCPADLDGLSIIDIPQQAQRADGEFNLVPTSQFLRVRRLGDIAISDANGVRTLLIDSRVSSDTVVLDPLSQVAVEGGSWVVFGGATNLEQNSDDYIRGSASLEFDIGATVVTTAGIQLSSPDSSQDLSGYIRHAAAVFANARITDPANIGSFKLRLGVDSSNYYEFTVTARQDGTAFAAGWNPLMFNMLSYTTVGAPDSTDVGYKALFMVKTTGKVNEAGYMFNYLVAKKGKYADVLYYSKYGWQNSSGTYMVASTAPDDLLVANTDEFDLYVKKGRVLAAQEVDLSDAEIKRRKDSYEEAKANYMMQNPSQQKATISTYYDYGNRDQGIDDSVDGITNY